jgi:hypothetical protein
VSKKFPGIHRGGMEGNIIFVSPVVLVPSPVCRGCYTECLQSKLNLEGCSSDNIGTKYSLVCDCPWSEGMFNI